MIPATNVRSILLNSFFFRINFLRLRRLSNRNQILCSVIFEIVSKVIVAGVEYREPLRVWSVKNESVHSSLENIFYIINANFIRSFNLL
jgi:hypothetical protein